MRSTRRPLTAKPEHMLDQQHEEFNYDDNTVQDSLQTLCEFLERFQYIDDFIFTTTSELRKLTEKASGIKHSKYSVVDIETRFEAIALKIPEVVTRANQADLVELITNEFDNLSALFAKIGSNPPATQNLSKAHKIMYKTLSNMLASAKESFASENMATLRTELRDLKHAISHEYETFFTLSKANSSRDSSVIDECRQSVDKIVSVSRLWNEIGDIQLPPLLKDMGKKFEQWKQEVSSTSKRSSSVSMIPKPPVVRGAKKEEQEVRRGGKIPRRSQSASRSSEKKPIVPADIQDPHRPTSARSQGAAVRSRRPASAANRPVKVDPVRRQPKNDSEDDFVPKTEDKRGRVQLSEWQTMEGKFSRHVAALGTNDVLGRFLTELRATAKDRKKQTGQNFEEHIEKLKKAMKQIEQKVMSTKPMTELGQKLRDAAVATESFVKQVQGGTTRAIGRELDELVKKLRDVQEKTGRVEWEVKLDDLRAELTMLQDTASRFAVGDTADLQQLMRENAEIQKKEVVSEDDTERKKVCTEMKVVQSRIATIVAERRDGQLDEAEAEDLEAELEALLEQQMGLIDQLATLR